MDRFTLILISTFTGLILFALGWFACWFWLRLKSSRHRQKYTVPTSSETEKKFIVDYQSDE